MKNKLKQKNFNMNLKYQQIKLENFPKTLKLMILI